MITWVVQRQAEEHRIQITRGIRSACLSTGNEFFEVDVIPFSHEISGEAPEVSGQVVVYGSTMMANTAKIYDWKPGVFRIYNESDTLAELGSNYLNNDMRSLSVSEVVPYVQSQGWDFFFAKPDKDLKSFDGTVFDAEEFPFFIERVRGYANYDPDTRICVSSIKHPEIEWRFVIVDKKVVAFSQYRVERRLDVKGWADGNAIKFAEAIASYVSPNDVYSYPCPYDIYVMDVCKINGEYKVIEYNTFNFSGLYACNIYDVVDSINQYLEKIE